MNKKIGICKLCGCNRKLSDSHLIPKFIFRWLKETGTGRLRNVYNIDKRIEDGIKQPFLCERCEEILRNDEDYFSRYIFYPVVNDNMSTFNYDKKLFRFVISVFWRILTEGSIIPDYTDEFTLQKFDEAKKEWAEFLLNNASTIKYNTLQMIIGGDLFHSEDNDNIPKGDIIYFARAVDSAILSNTSKCYLYLKIPRFIFLLPIYGLINEEYIETKVNNGAGFIDTTKGQIKDTDFSNFILNRLHQINTLRTQMSIKQKEISKKDVIKNWNRIKNSDFRIIIDYQNRKLRKDNRGSS